MMTVPSPGMRLNHNERLIMKDSLRGTHFSGKIQVILFGLRTTNLMIFHLEKLRIKMSLAGPGIVGRGSPITIVQFAL